MGDCDVSEFQRFEDDRRRLRREALIRRILYGLRPTVQLRGLTPETSVDDVRMDFTDKSAAFIAPLAETVEILEDIIFASDGCQGHRHCAHSMEPWRRARALLAGKWGRLMWFAEPERWKAKPTSEGKWVRVRFVEVKSQK